MARTLYGNIKFGIQSYYVIFKDNKNEQSVALVSAYPKDIIGSENYSKYYRNWELIRKGIVPENYIISIVKRSKGSNQIFSYGSLQEGLRFFDLIRNLNSYGFKRENVSTHTKYVEDGKVIEIFEASDTRYRYKKELEDKLYTHIEGSYGSNSIYVSEVSGCSLKYKVQLEEVTRQQTLTHAKALTLKSINIYDLENLIDLSWYRNKETGEVYKHYYTVKSAEDLENIIMAGVIKEARRCITNNEELKLVLDTETDGLEVYNLSDNNPLKSTVCAIPFGWAKDTSCVIFVDMEFLPNVNTKFVFERLRNLLENKSGKITIEQRQYPNPNLFEELLLDEKNYNVVDSITIDRSMINLIGHNVMFDGRVLFDNHVKPYWNNDTLQMAFNINPKFCKGTVQVLKEVEQPDGTMKQTVENLTGGVSLKNLTRRVFGHETPELSDAVGKGNEDKYRYISDEEVAKIYGCADADYPAALHDKLKELMPGNMYETYKKQDIPLMNILYEAEYNGLRVAEDEVKVLAQQASDDLDIIKKFLWSYVGSKIAYKKELEKLTVSYKADLAQLKSCNADANAEKMLNEKFQKQKENIKINSNAVYEFEMKASDLRKVLFEILEYPIVAWTNSKDNPQPATNKFVMKKLMSVKMKHSELKADVLGSDGKTVLISKDEFNKYRYPVAYVLSIFAEMNKEYTSYFKPIRDNNLEGKVFKNFSLSRIETRRIMNPSQTMKGSLKALTLPYDGGKDYYMLDFDMAQVEYRIMISLAWLLLLEKYPGKTKEEIFELEEGAESVYLMIENLKHPEADFHTESAAKITHKEPYQIDKKFRKKMKSVHFGIPYGLGERSLAEQMFGSADEKSLVETRIILSDFKRVNKPVIDMLEHVRDKSFEPVDFSDEFKRFAGFVHYEVNKDTGEITEHLHKVGKVQNLLGFYRLFDLEDLDKRKEGIIRRAAGNYPIQSFAAELFRIILIKFYNRCVKEGIADKIKWHMLIHDELLCSVHKSLNPFYIYKLILEECMPTFPGHTNYYVGINIGDNWAECKDDMSEAPVLFVQEMVKRWDAGEFKNDTWVDDAKSYVNKYKDRYMVERTHTIIKDVQPDIDNPSTVLDAELLIENMTNYTVRGYINDFFIPRKYSKGYGKGTSKWKSASDDFKFENGLLCWAGQMYGDGKLVKCLDGTIKKSVYEDLRAPRTDTNVEDEDDFDIIIDYDIETIRDEVDWGFDEDGVSEYSNILYTEEYDFDEVQFNGIAFKENVKSGKDITDYVLFQEAEQIYASIINDSLVIRINDKSLAQPVLKELIKHKAEKRNGIPVAFMINKYNVQSIKGFVSKDINVDALNHYVKELCDEFESKDVRDCKHLTLKDKTLIIRVKNLYVSDKVIKGMEKYKSDEGLLGMLYVNDKLVKQFVYIDKSIHLKRLDDFITKQTKLSIKEEAPLEHIHFINNMITIDLKNYQQVEQVKSILTKYQSAQGSIVKFRVGNRTMLWSRVRKDINFRRLDEHIKEVYYANVGA